MPTQHPPAETVALLAPDLSAAAWSASELALAGGGIILILLSAYGLFEWGLVLLKRLRAGGFSLGRAKVQFGLPSLAVALLPALVTALAIRLKLPGLEPDIFRATSLVLGTLVGGALVQAAALILFFRKAESVVKGMPHPSPLHTPTGATPNA